MKYSCCIPFCPYRMINLIKMVMIETRAFDPDRDYLWPIPRIELETNSALTQNPGY